MYKQIVLLTAVALILGITSHVMAQQDPNLFGWWKLDEGQGTLVADSSGKGHNGTINNPNGGQGPGGSTWLEDADRSWVLSFNGNNTTGTYVVTGATIPALGLTSNFSWAFWCKQSSAGGGVNQTMLGNRYGGTASPLQFIKFTPTKFEYYNNDTAYTTSITYAIPMPDGEWVHNAGVKKGATLTYYRNGIQMGASTTVGQTMDANPFYIGGDPVGERWNGQLSDVRLYNRALTDAEILAAGSQPKARKPNPANGALNVAMPLFQWTAGDGALFHNVYLGTSPSLTDADLKAPRQLMTLFYYVQGLTPGATYYWRVDEIEKDGVTTHTGDVWTFTVQDLTAYHPNPANKANEASPSPTLTWMPGQGAVKHQVYFSNSLDAVSQGAAAADKGTVALADATFAPGALESLKTYYWRVDEVLSGGVKTGPVWSFTTFLSIDDFESYTDNEGSRIYETWIDGMTNGTGSVVGNLTAPFAEQAIVHGGLQSMPLDYNNVKTPFYSEAELDLAPTGDWTVNDANALILYVRGTPGNKPVPLYVAVEDASKKAAVVTYPDQAIVAASKWTQWRIPLSSFTGVNLGKVKKLYIGVGDRKNPVADGSGRIYIDDIRVTTP
jgi:hypothetical protein